jgi:SanA protein
MFISGRKVLLRRVIVIGLLVSLVLFIPGLLAVVMAWRRTYSLSQAPSQQVAIIFGAGIWRDGSPTPVLRDRVATGAELYFSGKVQKLLMSGDNQFIDYNEPAAMRSYALSLGIPDQAIVLDYAGRRTYDTCYRAREIFGLDQAILVTQGFHLPRALFLCNALGITAVGVQANLREYRRSSLFYWTLREIPATLVAFWEVFISHPLPMLGSPEPIFPHEAQ